MAFDMLLAMLTTPP